MKRSVTSLFVLTAVAGCATAPTAKNAMAAKVTPLQEDIAFAQLAMEIPPAEAFARYTDPRSLQLPPAGPPVVGRDAIRARMEGLPAGALQWRPEGGETAQSGELAWTWGIYILHAADGDRTGKYVSIWHRTPDGHWLLAVDMGNQAPPRP